MLCWKIYCDGQTIDDVCKSRFTSEYYRRALESLELLMVKHNVSEWHLKSREFDAVLDCLYCITFYSFFLYFVYDFLLIHK